jgi:fructoselysine transporter
MSQPSLQRRLGLVQATALNMIDMVGIGPFVTLPLVMGFMGPNFLLAWLVGAGLASGRWPDLERAGRGLPRSRRLLPLPQAGLRRAEVGAADVLPLRVADAGAGPAGAGLGRHRLCAVLRLPRAPDRMVAAQAGGGTVVLLLIALLYRRIEDIGKLGVALWVGVLGLMGWLIVGGLTHANHQVAWLPAGRHGGPAGRAAVGGHGAGGHQNHLFLPGLLQRVPPRRRNSEPPAKR